MDLFCLKSVSSSKLMQIYKLFRIKCLHEKGKYSIFVIDTKHEIHKDD